MRILLSNDDGYRAPGLQALYESVSKVAQETTVIAPETNRSGASNSLTLKTPLCVCYADNGFIYVNGTPADCVHLAINGLLASQPDMVVAGINHGANMGDDVIYSGTVAAAIEGRFLGLPAIAVSLAGRELNHFNSAGLVVLKLLERLQADPLPDDTILNVNIPDIPFDKIEAFEATRLGSRHQSQPIIKENVEESAADSEQVYRIGPPGDEADAGQGTDFYAVSHNRVSVTPLQIDMTRHHSLEKIGSWLSAIR